MAQNGTKDWNYRLVQYFLQNHHLAIMTVLFIVGAGLFSFFQMQLQGFPQVKIPLAIVTVVAPGSGPQVVATTVVKPIENVLASIPDVLEISSTSRSNFGVIIVRLRDGVDTNITVQEARTKISSLTLPEGVQTPSISVPDVNGTPYLLSLTGGASIYELLKMSSTVIDEISAVDGVASVEVFSSAKNNFYIDLEPRNATPDTIARIRSLKTGFPIGEATFVQGRTSIAGASQISSLTDLENSFVRSVGRMYEAVDYGNSIHRTAYRGTDGTFSVNGGILFSIKLDVDADLLSVDNEIVAAIDRLNAKLPTSTRAVIVFNQADESRRQIKEIKEGAVGGKWEGAGNWGFLGYLLGGMWLLTVAILIFLNWRAALISLITVPLSFLITFIFLRIFNIQLNTIVLFSFVLVLGLIVDPAIVVLESITRYIEIGYHGKDAVLQSVKTIGAGIFMAVLTSAVVFVPFGVVSGTFGEIIKYIPITVIPALLASYFVPMLFLTWLGAKFIKPKHHLEEPTSENATESIWRGARWIVHISRTILSHTWLQIVTVLLSLVIPIGIAGILFSNGTIHQVQFSQPDDVEYLTLAIPRSATLPNSALLALGKEVEQVLSAHQDEIKSYYYGNMEGGDSPEQISLFVLLKPLAERDRKSPVIVAEIQKELRSRFGENAYARELSAGPPQGAYPVTVKIYSDNNDLLRSAQERVAAQLRTYPEVEAVAYDGEQTATELVVRVRDDDAQRYGLTAPGVYGQLAGALGETKLFTLDKTDVIVRMPPSTKPTTKEQLENIVIFGTKGPVTLSRVANVQEEVVPQAIQHFEGDQYAEVRARLSDVRDVVKVQSDIDEWTTNNAQSMGLDKKAFEKRGNTDEFVKSFQELFAAIIFSILISYIIFVLFFRSFVQPLIIIFAIPLTFIGVFPALAVFANGQLGFLEVLGIITLIGIVENVGLFLIDYANRLVDQGYDKKEAISIAAGVRFRAILLTKLTALGGLMPLAVFSPFWRGLAVTVVGGIITSGILSLFTTPVLYSWFTRRKPAQTALPVEIEVVQ